MPVPERPFLPDEFPGAIWYGAEEEAAALRVLRNRSPFRYYGPQCGFEVRQFEEETARFLAGKPGEVWGGESGTNRLVRIQTVA